MNLSYKLQGKKDIKNIYLRLYKNKFDVCVCTNLVVFESDFENEQSKSDNLLNENLLKLKLAVLKEYNLAFSKGVIVDANWLKRVVKITFERPTQEQGLINQDYTIYFSDFADYWIKNYATKWKTAARKNMSSVLLSQYVSFIGIFKDYEKNSNRKLEMRTLTQEEIYLFLEYLQGLNYSTSTVGRFLGRVRFFCNRATDLKFDVCSDHSQNFFFDEEDEIDGVYLDESEINKIINYDFSFDENLETTKDNFILGVYSGLRSSDLLTNLDISDFKDGYLKLTTQKTKTKVVIPIHDRVKQVIKKYHGMLPPKQTNSIFNKNIKIVCQICDIDNQMEGKVFDKIKKRKVKKVYYKYQLISCHTIRRSFCSNMRGKISDETLCKILSWSTSKMISIYDKTSNLTHANNLLDAWNKE